MSVNDVFSLFASTGYLIESVEEFNSACEHIVALLEEAESIFQGGGYSTATFLAITAIEETVKAHFGGFTNGGDGAKRRKDNVFFNHSKKHQMAAMPTVSMGKRLQTAIGADVLNAILEMSRTRELLLFRESSLYFGREDGTFKTPRQTVDKGLARALLLYAIEVFDDALVGFTDFSLKISKRTDTLFARLEVA